MSKNNIELSLFGQVLRLNCPPDQQAHLLASAQRLEERVIVLKEQTKILDLAKVLSIVALNLNYELEREQNKNAKMENKIAALTYTLTNGSKENSSIEQESGE